MDGVESRPRSTLEPDGPPIGSEAPSGASAREESKLAGALGRALLFRGADGRGLPLVVWLAVLGLAWALALLFAPLEPALVLVPPVLTLAILGPAVEALATSGGPVARVRALLARFEMPIAGIVFALIAVRVFGERWRRGMLIDTGDNQYMMARAQVFYEGLRHGHWMHWTHLWQAGDTLTDLYPVEANLLTAAVHALSPAGTSFGTSYTLFVLLSWWLRGVGVYYLARRFTSPLISFALACTGLFDVGSDVMGGVWFAAIYFGMVHNTLALTFGLFAVALQIDLTRRVTGPRFVACAAMVAITACGHALGMLVMVVTTFSFAVASWVARQSRREAAWALAASSLGLLLAAVWLIPFSRALAMGNFRVAMTGSTYSELGKGLMNGSMPSSSFVVLTGLGLVAALAAIGSREVGVAASGIASFIMLSLSLTQFMVSARVIHYLPAFADGQPARLLAAFKTVVVPCVAWLLGSLAGSIPRSTGSLGISRVLGRTLLLGILLYGPGRAMMAGLDTLASDLREQIKNVGPSAERSHTGKDYRRVFRWLADERRSDPSPLLYRAALVWRTEWRHAAWGEGLNTGVPIVDPNQVASNFFKIRPREVSARGFNDWNVKFVLTDFAEAPFAETKERFSSGTFHVWELEHFDDRYVVAPPGVRVSDLLLEGESIRFRVDGAPEEGADLQLRTAAFPRWRARQSGKWLKVGARLPRPDAKPFQEQIVVHAGNGEVLLTCDGTMPGYWTGLFVTIAGALGIGLGASHRRRDRFELWLRRALDAVAQRVSAARAAWRRPLLGAALLSTLALVVLGVVVHSRGARELSGSAVEGLGPFDVRWLSNGRIEPCTRAFWRGQFSCGKDDVIVDGWLGAKSPGDGSGEFAALWPGIRIVSRDPASVVLRFGRVRLGPEGLWIQNSTWNAHHAKITWGNEVLTKSDLSGEETHQFTSPSGTTGTKPLWIELEAPIAGSTCVIRGGAGKAPDAK